jgi:iron complex outermembrane receptor protein
MKFERKKIALALAYALGGTALLAGSAAMAATYTVTGTGIPRASLEGALPVQTISKEEIAVLGVTTTEELIQTVSAISSQNATQLTNAAGNSTYGFSGASLRGLGSARTLVLINGRRVVPFSSGSGTGGVNINNIPLAGIERVEVLKDGASAIYGADAIAGVINFIMASNYQGAEANIMASTPTRGGGGQVYQPSAVMGLGDYDRDRWNLTVTAQYTNQQALFAKDRSFAKTGNVPPFITAAATGQGNIEGGYIPGTGLPSAGETGVRVPGFGGSPGAGFGNPLALGVDRCATIAMFKNLTNSSKGAPYCTFDSNAFPNLIPANENTGLTGNFKFKLSDNIELFADALWSQNVLTNKIQPSPLRRSFLISDDQFFKQGVDPVLLLKPTNVNYPTAIAYLNSLPASTGGPALAAMGVPLAFTARVFDFGLRTNEDTSTQSRFTVGARGNWMKQDWEIAYVYNRNHLQGTVTDGYFSQVAFAKAVAASNDYNPFSLSQSAAFNTSIIPAKYVGATLAGTSDSNTIDAKISGDLWQLPAGPMQYALGYQWSDASLTTNPSPALFTGDIAGLGGATAPVDRKRTLNAVYAELAIPVIKSLDLNLQGRYDDYDDVGHKFTYKASLRWQPANPYLFRASYNTGFRPPTLPDLWLPQTLGTSEQFTDPAFPNNTDVQVPAFSGGNPLLKPETSKQYQFGAVWSPTPNFSFGAEYFHIKLNNIITTPSAQEVVSQFRLGDPAYQNLVRLTPDGQIDTIDTFLYNTGNATIAGWDFDGYWREKFSWGNLNLSYSGTYMNKYDQVSPGGIISHKVGTLVDQDGNPVLDANTGGVILRYKHILQLTYSNGPWAITGTQNWYNGYRTGNRAVDGEPNFVGNSQLYDLRIAYSGIKNVSLAIGAKNIFDKNPDIFVPVSNQFQAGYDINQYDARARYVYGQVGVKFQ